MTRIIQRECWFCGSTYGYMASGYGVSPGDWNRHKGVGYHYCAQCADKVTPFHRKIWKIEDSIEDSIRRMESFLRDPEGYFSWWRCSRKFPIRRDYAETYHLGKVKVQPMRRPIGGILFLDIKIGSKDILKDGVNIHE